MDYNWLIEAAGNDEKRLAQLAMLLTATGIMLSQSVTADSRVEMIKKVFEIRAAMHDVCARMGLDVSQMVKDVWGTTGQG